MDLLKEIQKDGDEALRQLYLKTRPGFLHYMSRYTQDFDLRCDAFHEAMLSFYEYCVQGKYNPKKSKPKTLIYRMGHAYLMNRIKREERDLHQKEDFLDKEAAIDSIEKLDTDLTELHFTIRDTLLKMGEKCRLLLELFFYHNYDIEGIRRRMNYKNENVVSSHKSRCLKKLKQLVHKNM